MDGHAARRAALAMIHRHSPGLTRRLTVGADKGYDWADFADFVNDLRQACVTPHVAQKVRHSAVDGRTTRHPGYAISQKRRKKTCAPFDWAKTVGPMAQTMRRCVSRVGAQFTLTMAACNLARLPRLLAVRVTGEGQARPATATNPPRPAPFRKRLKNAVLGQGLFQRPARGC
jgi:hypothetical protein